MYKNTCVYFHKETNAYPVPLEIHLRLFSGGVERRSSASHHPLPPALAQAPARRGGAGPADGEEAAQGPAAAALDPRGVGRRSAALQREQCGRA